MVYEVNFDAEADMHMHAGISILSHLLLGPGRHEAEADIEHRLNKE